MDQEDCNVFILKLTDAMERDWKEQRRGRRYSASRFAEQAHEHFPQLIKVSHLRVGRDAAKKLLDGKKAPGMAPCSAITGLLGYLFHFEGNYEWTHVRRLIYNEGKQFEYILKTKPRQTGFSETMVKEIVKVGDKPTESDAQYLKELIDLLKEKNERLEFKRTQEFDKQLEEHKKDLKRLEKLRQGLSGAYLKELNAVIENMKQKISFFETL